MQIKDVINIDINIWDEFDEQIGKKYHNKTYTTYAYIESSSHANVKDEADIGVAEHALSNDESLSILHFLKDKLVENKIVTDEDLFIHYFITGENLKSTTLLSKFFEFFTATASNKVKLPFHYERYELCFKNLTHEQLDNEVLPFLQSSNLDFVNYNNGTIYQLNVYSES